MLLKKSEEAAPDGHKLFTKNNSHGKEIYNNTPAVISATRMAWCALQTE
ncbi:putative mobilization protein [Bacteroides fragilis str. 3719 A10]|nr:putative mobilization protein [Bacteroides fragilis str. 3719 A10]